MEMMVTQTPPHILLSPTAPVPLMRVWVLVPLYEGFASLFPWLFERWDSIINCRKSTLPWEGKQESLFGDLKGSEKQISQPKHNL